MHPPITGHTAITPLREIARRCTGLLATAIFILLFGPAVGQSLAGYRKAAANPVLELWVDEANGCIALRSLRDGILWTSSPAGWDRDESAAGAVRMALGSTLSIRYADDLGKMQVSNSYPSVVMNERLTVEDIEGGVRLNHYFYREGLSIPLDLRLGPDWLEASVPIAEVRKDKIPPGSSIQSFDLNTLTILPYFGATSSSQGLMLVPDGSGAIIRFSNGRSQASFSEPVYGRDPSVYAAFRKQVTETLALPVFGMDRGAQGGFLAVIGPGESRAYVNAETGGQKSSFNACSATFIYKDSDSVGINDRFNQRRDIRVLEDDPSAAGRFAVTYFILPRGASGYPQMAERYRRYLTEKGLLQQSPSADRNALYLDLFGCARKIKPVIGIPMPVIQDYTRYSDALGILTELSAAGVDDMVVRYQGWMRGGAKSALPLKARPERVLGGEGGWRNLLKGAAGMGAKVYPEADLLSMYRANPGQIRLLMASRTVLKAPLTLREYRMSTFTKDDERPSWMLLRPALLPGVLRGYLDSLGRWETAGAALSSLGNLIYSDFGSIDRAGAQSGRVDLLGQAASGRGLLFAAPLAYALGVAEQVMELPAYSSRYDIEDAAVPFYQMVIRGSLPYAMSPGNVHPDASEWKLKLLETGSQPAWLLVYRNADELVGTDFDYLYSVDYRLWRDDILATWRELGPILERLRGQALTDHRLITPDLRVSTYANGVSIAVNYGRKEGRLEGGRLVPAGGYIVWGGGL
jgi:hypothetical protein